jgi:WD40 repeat protein
MEYLDFDLEIKPEGERQYHVVAHSSLNEAHSVMCFPFDESQLEKHLMKLQNALLRSSALHRRVLAPDEQAVQEFGKILFNTLFAEDLRQHYAFIRKKAAEQEKGVRLRLRFQAPELAALPWEYMYNEEEAEYVCLSLATPIIRYLELPKAEQPLTVTLPLRILIMLANPLDQDRLDIEREKERIHQALGALEKRGLVELTWLEGQTWRDLQQALWDGPWHIFHLVGHGGYNPHTDEGMIALADEAGKTHLLPATHLGRLLASHHSLRLVVLNACNGAKGGQLDLFSSTAATLARRGIPAVLAMQEEITDRAAIELTRTFYTALAHGLAVDAAVGAAREAISVGIPHSLEWGVPVLYMRAPDGCLFILPSEQKQAIKVSQHVPLTQNQRAKPFIYRGHTSWVTDVAWSPDGKLVASAEADHKVHVWNAATRETILVYHGHAQYVKAVAWSPTGKRIASCGWDGTVQVWDSVTGAQYLIYRDHTEELVNTIAWSPDGRYIASAGKDTTVQVWDAATGSKLHTYHGHSAEIWDHIAWSPDGAHIASGAWDGTVQVWDAFTRSSSARIFRGHTLYVNDVAWSPDGKYIASADKEGVQVWDVSTGEQILSYRSHTDMVVAVAWSHDGKRIASGSQDKTVRVWDAASGREMLLYRHSKRVTAVAWSPDDTQIISASTDKTARIWPGE